MNTTEKALSDFFADLGKLTHSSVRTDSYNRVLYSTDASIYQVIPFGVFIPNSMEEVHAAIELAAKYKIPILPRTSGSSLAGQAINEAVIIDMSKHLNEVLEINRDEKWVRVQPGIVLDELNAELQSVHLQFGPDPASSNRAALGGIVANNSTGAHSILYGMTADHVLETNVILSDGSQAHFKPLSNSDLAAAQKLSGLDGAIYRSVSGIAKSNEAIIKKGTPKH